MIGETIEDMRSHHNDEWIMVKTKSNRAFKFTSNSYYGGESDISYDEVDISEWEKLLRS